MDNPKLKICYDTSKDDVVNELYLPCFKWAYKYDRGVGYFTSGWLKENLEGIGEFVTNGGTMRFLTSPILSEKDIKVFNDSVSDEEEYALLNNALLEGVEELKQQMGDNLYNTLAWLIHDQIIEFRFVVPTNKLKGMFHDKFGVFYRDNEKIAFTSSINDSENGFSNFESITTYSTYSGTEDYVKEQQKKFERIWKQEDKNLKTYMLPSAVERKIFELKTDDRPYGGNRETTVQENDNKWIHQDKAVAVFVEKKNGILAMATGTGKTRTAFKIIDSLSNSNLIDRVVIVIDGVALISQWQEQLIRDFKKWNKYYQFGALKELTDFLLHPNQSILLVSRNADNLNKVFRGLDSINDSRTRTLWIFDEVHGAGSETISETISRRLSEYYYRLGLSATPEREYDEKGNEVLMEEIGEIIFEFNLKDAIEKGILCEFDYYPLSYELTNQEKAKKASIIKAFEKRKKAGEPVDETEMYRDLAKVNKTAINKIYEFEDFIKNNQWFLKDCILFVETKAYGEKLQEILINYNHRYHTFYDGDELKNLDRFSEGSLDYLITCQRISEGIDISRVTNIALFASDRSKLVTTQRIGRALRTSEDYPDKKASVVDFVISDDNPSSADSERMTWLKGLSQIRRKV